MGKEMMDYIKTKLKKEHKFAFVSSFIITLLIHFYKFSNTLPNHDSLYNYYSDQNVLGSGRWALSLACGISSYFDLPWVNGLMCCVAIALTVAVIVALFDIKNSVLIMLIGALFAAAPATTETLFFMFTADGYLFAMLLAALAVYFSRISEERISRWIVSGICICVACGIYQAYVSFALVLATSYFIVVLLQNRHEKLTCLKWILRQTVIYSTSLVAYYAIWKLLIFFTGTAINDYQGISEVGKLNVSLLLHGFIASVSSVVQYFLQWNVLEHGFSFYSVLNVIFVIVMGIGLLIAMINSKIIKRKWAALLLCLCVAVIIPFSCIWNFVSDSVGYRPMMLQCVTLLFALTALFYERWSGTILKNVVALFLTLIVFNNAIMANISYYYMHLCYERTYSEGVEMMMEIHDLQDEYDCQEIAIIGNRASDVALEFFDSATGGIAPAGKIFILSNQLEASLFSSHAQVVSYLETTYGLELASVSVAKLSELSNLPEVKAMGCWPAGDSVAVIDGAVIIKLADIEEVA